MAAVGLGPTRSSESETQLVDLLLGYCSIDFCRGLASRTISSPRSRSSSFVPSIVELSCSTVLFVYFDSNHLIKF